MSWTDKDKWFYFKLIYKTGDPILFQYPKTFPYTKEVEDQVYEYLREKFGLERKNIKGLVLTTSKIYWKYEK